MSDATSEIANLRAALAAAQADLQTVSGAFATQACWIGS
jgi:hypothetical protein